MSRGRGRRRNRLSSSPKNARAPRPARARYRTVGHRYRGIEHGLERLVARHGETGVFIGPPQALATTAVFEWSELTTVTDLASA